ncbi:SNF2 family helicase/ATPase-like protein [Corynespora cassiicola Philippines]|uniref:SNF2 family helicase/ATPase-like protein n=1 Tax=Corynespora cassiicola Philippines TaxID=1448308 RepID=A0A2T2P0Y9_CORCC|nr:SNF2 family helicase/ATPase-like protein [Corynespora cassiicola Philippines]
MDPSMLLDPRGLRRRGGDSSSGQPQPRPAQYDPRALLNPKLMPKRPASEEVAADRGREEPPLPGQISLVERLHNVHERTASPSKRVKTDDERAKSRPHAAMGSGNALNLQTTSARPTPVSTPGPPPIDLTMSDDEEDVRVVQDNSSQLICIGQIKQAYIQSHCVPFPDPRKYRGNGGQQSRIKVSFRRTASNSVVIPAIDPTGVEFGRVDVKTAQGLAPLMDAAQTNGLKWLAWTCPRRKQPGEGPPGSPLSTLIGITLQLYCPRKHADSIGQYLAKRQINLADPLFELQLHDYYNPQTKQCFQRQDAMQPTFEPQPYVGNSRTTGNYTLRSAEEIRTDVQNMFDTIINTEEISLREPSPLIKTPLYPHQKRALQFMWDKEQDWSGEEAGNRKDLLWQLKFRNDGRKYYEHVITGDEADVKPPRARGGILADEMGLGKTLSILSLIADFDSLQAAQIFSAQAPPPNPYTVIPQVKNSRATLLVCPLSTMINWKNQIEEHFSGSGLKWVFYHGPERKTMTVDMLADHDLVITTYQVVAGDVNDRNKAMQYIHWFRVVLDEAHAIRSPSTKQSIGACSLAARNRWAVTGTPVQNRLEDLGALFRFIRLEPFNTTAGFNSHILNPFKEADPDVVPKLQLVVSSVTLRRLKQGVIDLPARHDSIVRLRFSRDERKLHDWFEQDSARKVNAVTSGDKLGGNTYARILTAILNLRLICAHGRDLLNDEALKLTDGMTYENPVDLDDEEEEIPALTRNQAYDMLELLNHTDNDRCQICRRSVLETESDDEDEEEDHTIGFMTSCYHLICPKHIKRVKAEWSKRIEPDGLISCQFCATRVRPTTFELKNDDWAEYQDERDRMKRDPKLLKKVNSYTGPHTKTKALLEDLQMSKDESLARPHEPPVKSVIFSTWTTHLDLLEIALKNYGHTYVRLDGRMSRSARDKAIETFSHNPDVRNILISIGAGGLGLNLTMANKVYVMEPQFNPAAEAQAVDRVHRLGQTREVTIKRFIMEDSFEEKMLELQRKKKALADLTMAREKSSKEQAAKQRLEDLRSLFK